MTTPRFILALIFVACKTAAHCGGMGAEWAVSHLLSAFVMSEQLSKIFEHRLTH